MANLLPCSPGRKDALLIAYLTVPNWPWSITLMNSYFLWMFVVITWLKMREDGMGFPFEGSRDIFSIPQQIPIFIMDSLLEFSYFHLERIMVFGKDLDSSMIW